MDTGEKFDRSVLIAKIADMSEEDVMKVMIFMAGMEAGAETVTDGEVHSPLVTSIMCERR